MPILFFVLIALFIGFAPEANAAEVRQCTAVTTSASLKYPVALIVSVAEDRSKRTCDFAVILPPPHTASADVESWFKARLPIELADPKTIETTLKGIAVVTAEARAKEIGELLGENREFLSFCVSNLFKKAPGTEKSKNGRIQCTVPNDAQSLEFKISANTDFTLTAVLPRLI